MDKIKGTISFRTLVLLFAAMLLCAIGLVGAVGATQAQLVFESEQYEARIAQTHLGVALLEQSGTETEPVVVNIGKEGQAYMEGSTDGRLLREDAEGASIVLGEDKQMIPGKTYAEQIFAQNASVDMGQYVRLTVYKYWTDNDGNKLYDMDPALIVLEEAGNGWVKSEAESTDERLVFYHAAQLAPQEVTGAAISSIKLDPEILNMKDQLKAMDISEFKVHLSADVDVVQTKHAPDAAKSAWGVDISELGLNW